MRPEGNLGLKQEVRTVPGTSGPSGGEVRPLRSERGTDDAIRPLPVRPMQSGIVVREFDRERDRDAIRRFTFDRDIDVEKDSIFVAEIEGRIVGVLAERLIPLVHSFEVDAGSVSRRVADALIQYGSGYTRASGFREVMFLVLPDNVTMATFLEQRGAMKEEPADVYALEVR